MFILQGLSVISFYQVMESMFIDVKITIMNFHDNHNISDSLSYYI